MRVNTMVANSAEAVELGSDWSQRPLSDVEKVAIAAIALHTTNSEAINDLTGITKHHVDWFLGSLQENGWDIPATLREQASDQSGYFIINQETYPILQMKGVVA